MTRGIPEELTEMAEVDLCSKYRDATLLERACRRRESVLTQIFLSFLIFPC